MKFAISFFIILLSFSASCDTSDSLRIKELFDYSTIQQPEKQPSKTELLCLSKHLAGNSLEGLFYYEWSRYMFYQTQTDSAESVAITGLKRIIRQKHVERDKIKLLNILAAIQSTRMNYEKGVKLYEKALKLAEKLNDSIQMAYINNNLANVFFSLQDYPKAYFYSSNAFRLIKNHPDTTNYCAIIAILALSEAKNSYFKSGLIHADKSITCSQNRKDVLASIIAHHAKGQIHLEMKEIDKSLFHFEESLKWATLARRAEYMTLNSIGLLNAYLVKNDYKKAVFHGETALSLSKKNIDKTTTYSIKKNLAKAYNKLDNHEMAYKLLFEAHELFREKNSSEKQEAINELLIKYDSERKEKALAKNQITILENENSLQKVISISFALGFGLFLVLALLFILRFRNKKRLELLNKEKQELLLSAVIEGEENERKRISIELHDGLASILTAARYQLKSGENKSVSKNVDELLRQAHEDTRRLSHYLAPLRLEKWSLLEALHQIAKDNSLPGCIVNVFDLTEGKVISKEGAMILYRVAQELIQNAIKYARAKSINMQLSHTGQTLVLIVEDDGIGFSVHEIGLSNGLSSIKTRADQLKGSFEINSTSGKGTIAIFTIPS